MEKLFVHKLPVERMLLPLSKQHRDLILIAVCVPSEVQKAFPDFNAFRILRCCRCERIVLTTLALYCTNRMT